MNALRKKIILFFLFILSAPVIAHAAQPDDILGVWNNEEKDGKIEISKCGDKYCGKIVWVKETQETPRFDIHNPDPAKRSRPILGLPIMNGFSFAGKNEWKGGTVYDPKTGNTYRGKMTLVSPGKLDMRGYVGIPLFGRTTAWTRQEN